jgi:hypothetical protein
MSCRTEWEPELVVELRGNRGEELQSSDGVGENELYSREGIRTRMGYRAERE